MQKLLVEIGLGSVPAGIAVVDAAGGILRCNDHWQTLMPASQGRAPLRRVLDAEPGRHVHLGEGRGARLLVAGPPIDSAKGPHRVVLILDNGEQQALLDTVADLSDRAVNDALALRDDNAELERRVRERTAQLRDSRHDTVLMLATASEARDADTGAHVRRIRDYAAQTARALGWHDGDADDLGEAAMLHDIGKIQIPDAVLQKPGRLTDDERALMQTHTLAGEQILGDSDAFALARSIARSHHERPDGAGYPDGLAGDDIPQPARIVHVVDVFDALSSPRVYKDGWPRQEVIDTLRNGRGTEFDGDTVDAFLTTVTD